MLDHVSLQLLALRLHYTWTKFVGNLKSRYVCSCHKRYVHQICVQLKQGVTGIFSGGLDIMEMADPDPDRLGKFWRALQQAWIQLYGSNLATVAAINVRYVTWR